MSVLLNTIVPTATQASMIIIDSILETATVTLEPFSARVRIVMAPFPNTSPLLT